jgi:hypothetical protein
MGAEGEGIFETDAASAPVPASHLGLFGGGSFLFGGDLGSPASNIFGANVNNLGFC